MINFFLVVIIKIKDILFHQRTKELFRLALLENIQKQIILRTHFLSFLINFNEIVNYKFKVLHNVKDESLKDPCLEKYHLDIYQLDNKLKDIYR